MYNYTGKWSTVKHKSNASSGLQTKGHVKMLCSDCDTERSAHRVVILLSLVIVFDWVDGNFSLLDSSKNIKFKFMPQSLEYCMSILQIFPHLGLHTASSCFHRRETIFCITTWAATVRVFDRRYCSCWLLTLCLLVILSLHVVCITTSFNTYQKILQMTDFMTHYPHHSFCSIYFWSLL